MAKDEKAGRSDLAVYALPFINLTTASTGDIILYDAHLAVYKHSLDLILYFIASPQENELILSTALNSLVEALTMLLRNSLEKRGVLENLDLVLLCLDETVDNG
jgi:coatomer subunit zeta